MAERVMFLTIPGLRPGDVHDPNLTPVLHELATSGASLPLIPTFPCVTSCVQASMLTGVGPGHHGVIANGFFHPERQSVDFWVGTHKVLDAPSLFTRVARARPDLTSAVWHAQNIKEADATFIVTPAPIHEPDGTTKLWCYSKPDDLYAEMLAVLGHFPLQHYWGPLANIRSTQWILEAVLWLARRHAPNFQYIYIPHLDYASQKFGPDSREAAEALHELDKALGAFLDQYDQLPFAGDTKWVLAGEYAMTPVDGAVFPNRILRQAGLLQVRREGGTEYLDLPSSKAFAMVDHQFAHVYVRDTDPELVAELFAGSDEIPDIIVGRERSVMGMEHLRSAPVILISRRDRWFAYPWWMEDAAAPPFARTVDIHAKPGYDPLELFIEMPSRTIPLNTSLVKGSHGAPAVEPSQQTLLITTEPGLLDGFGTTIRDTDVFTILSRALGIGGK